MNITLLIACCLVVGGYAACPAGTEEESGYCFAASRGSFRYWEAANMCDAFGCSIAYASDSAEKTALLSYASKNSLSTDYWVGIMDTLEEGTWLDTNTKEEAENIDWKSGHPETNRNKNCGVVANNSYKIKDDSCGASKRFICECGTA